LWQALTGSLPPPGLPAEPIAHATLDSRAVEAGDLFVPMRGPNTDGHHFVGAALGSGARAVISEAQGRAAAEGAGAVAIDCTGSRGDGAPGLPAGWTGATPLVFVVEDTTRALQEVGGFQRVHRTRSDLRTIGITGSVGKTSTKELVAAVMGRRFRTLYSPGNLNSEQGLPLTLLGLDRDDECAVLEMGMYAIGEITTLCSLARPQVGIVTNVGPVHLQRLGTIENIALAKSELPRALPSAGEGGVAILNWDDENVRAMAEVTAARIFRYGLTPEADLWADEIASAGMEGIRFRFHYQDPSGREDSLHVRVPLLGRHSVHTALRATSAGLVYGLEWDEIITGMQSMPGQLRLVSVPGINGSTVIDDTYNASPDSTIAALNLLADLAPEAGGRRVAVLGDMLELGSYSESGHRLVGARAANVADLLLTVGRLGHDIGEEAVASGMKMDAVQMMGNDLDAVGYLRQELRENDIVLVKGSRAVGMDAIVAQIAYVKDGGGAR
jgi:UDP-N-acetylmuramoyl-tripeptide--D-alanyl-D-alanine ligase